MDPIEESLHCEPIVGKEDQIVCELQVLAEELSKPEGWGKSILISINKVSNERLVSVKTHVKKYKIDDTVSHSSCNTNIFCHMMVLMSSP
jgi:hypothetical protein